VSTNSLGNFESQKYESLVEEHLTVSAVIVCQMSLEVNYLDLDFVIFSNKVGALLKVKYGERCRKEPQHAG